MSNVSKTHKASYLSVTAFARQFINGIPLRWITLLAPWGLSIPASSNQLTTNENKDYGHNI